ncbi:hypothetical protein NDU88_005318 [Pleurodeles waltl]|uniref:Uncharacterized protein n=1 Tax=Pleurodeles waltl TaxID=8319 RepID=A0AAV7TBL4_PLEWA|nr:hypothetical protein NDU88_005318 [Pleurodeles waltl]
MFDFESRFILPDTNPFQANIKLWRRLPDSHVTGNTHAVLPGRRAFLRLRQRSLQYAGTSDLGKFSAHQHLIYQVRF